jgi:hypothetical protein
MTETYEERYERIHEGIIESLDRCDAGIRRARRWQRICVAVIIVLAVMAPFPVLDGAPLVAALNILWIAIWVNLRRQWMTSERTWRGHWRSAYDLLAQFSRVPEHE